MLGKSIKILKYPITRMFIIRVLQYTKQTSILKQVKPKTFTAFTMPTIAITISWSSLHRSFITSKLQYIPIFESNIKFGISHLENLEQFKELYFSIEKLCGRGLDWSVPKFFFIFHNLPFTDTIWYSIYF